jgi:hypothetical protein
MTHRIPRGRTAVDLLSALLGTVSLIPLSSVAFAAGLSEQLRAQTPAPRERRSVTVRMVAPKWW